ncbi:MULTISPECIES: response regulator transcription factor [unclassified Kocuria]|uniref:response regulator transcription factor n=1 Tax=unclassified Kocuria TaxID=2649579 RepID=UPI0009E5FDBA|nr:MULTISPECIES: response regulator transcription factor [unclassified Kocuria]
MHGLPGGWSDMAEGLGEVHDGRTSILVVDDHTTFAELLTGALRQETDLHAVGVADDVESSVRLCGMLRPDVVVMDYHLSGGNGVTAAARILRERPGTRIVMLTGDPAQHVLEAAAATGICAFLPKDGSLATLLETIRSARCGTMAVHPSLLAADHPSRRGGAAVPALTQRELQVLQLMAQGHSVGTNARLLSISPNTCRGYVKTILAKLGAHSQLEAVAVASRLGLLTGRS